MVVIIMQDIHNHDYPLISIITPAYNSEAYIRETIQSVQAQTYTNWEMIIVDDCSTDATREIVKQLIVEDNRISLFKLEKNSGPAVARNTAIKHAKGRYLAFLDSDDMWLPEKLEKQFAFMSENNYGFSFTEYVKMSDDGKLVGKPVQIPEKVDYKKLLKRNVIGCLTVMIDTDVVGEVEMVNIRSRQDYVLWLSLCKKGFPAYGLQECLSKYRIVENSVSRNKIKMAKQNWKVYRKIEKLGFFKSAWYFGNYVYLSLKK